jgi:DNA processing protein
MNNKEALVTVSSFLAFGPVRTKLLLAYFDNPLNIWKAEREDLLKTGLSNYLVERFIYYRNKFDVKNYFDRLNKLDIKVITYKDKDYPVNLKEIEGAPLVLYYKGTLLKKDETSVAIVGSRQMSEYGEKVTKIFTLELVKHKVTIISGLARGIDSVAHKETLKGKGRTIAVLGCGLDFVYPPENKELARQIAKSGAVISEYPLGIYVRAQNFAARNRIISGLAKIVLVIEGAAKSGTLITASHAATQGKTVFAIPGNITSPLSAAPHFLLKEGCIPATHPDDLLRELKLIS